MACLAEARRRRPKDEAQVPPPYNQLSVQAEPYYTTLTYITLRPEASDRRSVRSRSLRGPNTGRDEQRGIAPWGAGSLRVSRVMFR